MSQNTAVIDKFYTAFAALDSATMNSCYSDDIVFFDPAFGLLKGQDVKFMWQMLCQQAQQFSLTYSNIKELDDEYYTVDWVASYVFSRTQRPVVNKVKGFMRIRNGIIVEHSDGFSIHKWSKQALGLFGELFGWNTYFQNRLQKKARKKLFQYIESTQ